MPQKIMLVFDVVSPVDSLVDLVVVLLVGGELNRLGFIQKCFKPFEGQGPPV